MKTSDTLERIIREKVIALIRADGPGSLLECAGALAAGGLNVIELTMTTPGAIGVLAQASKSMPGALLGLGTVLDAATVKAGVAAGARFIVTPGLRPEVIKAAHEEGVPVLSGAFTPTEVAAAADLGADIVKIFPAEFFGPAYIKSLRAVFPNIRLMPTGGVTAKTLGDFLKAGACAAAAGSSLVEPAALKARDWPAVTARAREFAQAAAAAQS
ncbi:MAG TPA: bifunctional 4-hydroxy-2-oxoglutarate aldolase/2-dehydro-3-deoxy-phosphogluconate aldolase [Opitutaceae bacterium]|jgi:2-dehydro-3-deoxyphosphogluconate aldolase/(4S)-4-hydroxy-2-oxoglutarate aldolase